MDELTKLREENEWMEDEDKRKIVINAVAKLDDSCLDGLYKVTPYVLRLTDHHSIEAKSAGLQCISCLIDKFSINNLQSVNFDGLFYQTLKNMLYNNDLQLNEYLISTLIRFINRFEYGDTEIEQVFSLLIRNADLTTNNKLKILYIRNLQEICKILDKRTKKFTKQLLVLIGDTLQEEINEETCQVMRDTCSLFLLLIHRTTGLSGNYFHQMIMILLKLRIKLSDPVQKGEIYDGLIHNVIECMRILSSHNPLLFAQLKSACENDLKQFTSDYQTLLRIFTEIKISS